MSCPRGLVMADAGDDTYALVEPEPPQPAAATAGQRLPSAPATSYRAIPAIGKSPIERALEAREDEAKPSRVRDLILPLILLPLGLIGQAVGWWEVAKTPRDGLLMIAAALTLQLFIFTPAGLLSVATVAKWFELGLGRLPVVLFKIATLSVGTAGVADIFFLLVVTLQDFDAFTIVAGYGMYLVLVGVPLMILLELNVYEMALTVLMLFLPRMAAVVAAVLMFRDHFP